MKKIFSLTFILIYLVNTSFVNAFLGETADLNLYKKVDSGVLKIKSQLIENELKGSSSEINNNLEKNGLARYFDENSDFNATEISSIIKGSLTPIFKHSKKEYIGKSAINSTNLAEITGTVIEWYKNKASKIEKNISNMNKIGSMGLYYDGDTGNSGYDLMFDLEQINNVIFSAPILYNGKGNINKAKGGFSDLLNNPSADLSDNPSTDLKENENITQNAANNTNDNGSLNNSTIINNAVTTTNSLGNNIVSTSCLTGNLLNNNTINGSSNDALSSSDKSLLNDLNNQLINGSNSNSSVGGQNTQDQDQNPVLNNGVGNGSSLSDSFPCSDIFCVTVNFVMYQQNLLGGKNHSIEGILDRHYKIAAKIASLPLEGSEMTKTSFSLSILEDLNLPSMFHMGIVISSLPLPILTVKKKLPASGGKIIDSGIEDFSDEQIYSNIFEQYGLTYESQNDLSNDNVATTINNCPSGNTDLCKQKLAQINGFLNPSPEYDSVIYNSLKNNYLGSFNNDLIAFITYSQQLGSKIDTITHMAIQAKSKK